MRFNEISEQALTELSRPQSRFHAENVLIDAGYRQLGRGANATVWQKHGASYVLKVFDPRDEAYTAFIKLAQDNPNPHFPRFHGKMIRVTTWYSAIRTERLSPYEGTLDELNFIDQYIIKKRDSLSGMNGSWEEAYKYVAAQPELQAACDALAKMLHATGTKYFCDLHRHNVMMRGSTVVLSDPLGTTAIM